MIVFIAKSVFVYCSALLAMMIAYYFVFLFGHAKSFRKWGVNNTKNKEPI